MIKKKGKREEISFDKVGVARFFLAIAMRRIRDKSCFARSVIRKTRGGRRYFRACSSRLAIHSKFYMPGLYNGAD